MYFRQTATFRGLRLERDAESINFPVPDECGVVVTVRPPSKDEIERARKKGRTEPEYAEVAAQIELDPPNFLDAFASIAKRRLPEGSPRELLGTRWVDAEGNLLGGEIIHADHLAGDLQAFLEDVQDSLCRAVRAVCDAASWRLALSRPRDPVAFGLAYWSVDGESWEIWPTGKTGLALSGYLHTELPSERQSYIQELLDTGRRQPLAHALWREAVAQQKSNPRSAILIGIAALEVGLKQFAATHIPDADWLLREAPTPPVVKMLSTFLPSLPPLQEETQFERPSKATLKTVGEAVALRNDIAHKGVEYDPPDATVAEVLSTVRGLLWRFDLATGVEWAEEYVDNDA
jgi:hypothetical protein